MSVAMFTTIHVMLSLIGIVAGFIALIGMIRGKLLELWATTFLLTTVLTSLTGFPIPPLGLDPPRIVGIISLVLLAVAIAALYFFSPSGRSRWLYVVTSTAALYLNCFVGVVQSFQKIPFIHALAPTQAEPPFAIAQIAVLAIFIFLGVLAVRNFHPKPTLAAVNP